MTPTTEQLAAMEARGWTWDREGRAFRASPPTALIFATVRHVGDGWYATYGGRDVEGGAVTHPTPLLAADEAEAWLRGVLEPFRFPWLRMDPYLTTNTSPDAATE